MENRNKIISIVLVLVMVGGMIAFGGSTASGTSNSISGERTVLNVWYADESLKDYVERAALAYQEENDIKVIPTYVSGLEYIESINAASVNDESGPDVYIIGNDSLEKAVMAGLATNVTDANGMLNTTHFPQTALDAVTYHGKQVGYPMYFETGFLLYNETLLEQMAETAIQEERDTKAGEEAMEDIEENGGGEEDLPQVAAEHPENAEITKEEIAERTKEMIPDSFTDILAIAGNYDTPEGVETMFKWDISDVFYNYQFAGAYMNLGGACGDDKENISIYNADAMYCLGIYQDLNQFFSIEAEEVSYNEIMDEFLDGKILFTFATTDCLKRIEAAKEEGKFPCDFGVTTITHVNNTLSARSLSVTRAVAVNGYSKHQEEANAFASFMACDYSKNLYDKSGKMPSYFQEEYVQPGMKEIMTAYANSVSLPKFVETANYWILAEMCYTNIWKGEDINKNLKELSDTMKSQIFGKIIEEEQIETPDVTEDYNAE